MSAPGRACLFGEHQDYLGLPVVPCALNLRNRIRGETRRDDAFIVTDAKHGSRARFRIGDLGFTGDDFDYLRAVVRVLLSDGCELSGAEIRMSSEVPLRSGLSSSAAMLVSWAKFLDEAYDIGLGPIELGMVGYRAEHDEMDIPCGMMDQISSSVGGIIHMECTDPPRVKGLRADVGGIVVADTLIRKRTVDVHGERTREISHAIANLESLMGRRIDLSSLPWSEVQPLRAGLGELQWRRLRAAILNREVTVRATSLLERGSPDLEQLGKLLLTQQALLRDDYEVSHPRIERLIEAGLSAGALGGKLTGAGLGGFVVLLAPGCQEEVATAVRRAGGVPHVVEVDEGARRE